MAKINPKRIYTTQKIDLDFAKEMREIGKLRYMKGLEKKEPKLTEMTRLLRRTPSYQQSLIDLKVKPRKEDIKKIW